MMIKYFTIHSYTPWDGKNTKELNQIQLYSLKNIFKKFPVIEQSFFDDLIKNSYGNIHYSWMQCIRRVVGPDNEDYDISSFNLVWAFDTQNRMFQFLFQLINEPEKPNKTQGILVALAPPELAKLFSEYKEDALLSTLSLLNDPSQIRFLITLAPKGKSIAQESQAFRIDKNQLDKLQFINSMGKIPNIQGQWFPSFEAKCPICNEIMTEIKGLDYRIGLGKLICPRCGYEKKK